MKTFTRLALLTAAIAGGYYLYKEIEKQKQLAEGEDFDDSDLFEDEMPIGDAADSDGDIDIEAEDGEEAPSRYANIKAKATDVAHKVTDKTKDIAAVVSEKAGTIAQATKEKAAELKEYISSKFENAEDAADAAEDAADAVKDAAEDAGEDWTGKLEDAEEKVDEIAADLTDAVDPD